MRQANHAIKGYLYQFLKTIHVILTSKSNKTITVEGKMEDIDIMSESSTSAVQCKYHEKQRFSIASVSVPILEMLCNFALSSAQGKKIKYYLYAYFEENISNIELNEFIKYIEQVKSPEILAKYFHRLYEIEDDNIIFISNKNKKSKEDKRILANFYIKNKNTLKLKVNISEFWENFYYSQGKSYDELKDSVMYELGLISDTNTAEKLYFPNALSIIAEMSSFKDVSKRRITKEKLLQKLSEEKDILVTQWAVNAIGLDKIYSYKRKQLSSEFAINPNVRAFIFTKSFLSDNISDLQVFIREYISKYNRKSTLHRPPIFIFDEDNKFFDEVISSLFDYQIKVNSGMIGSKFNDEAFIKNTNCSSDFKCKVILLKYVNSIDILERCNVDYLLVVGKLNNKFISSKFKTDSIDVRKVSDLKYITGLAKALEG